MRQEDFEEDWVDEALVSCTSAAESEFSRYKLDLKRKAGLLQPTPLSRVKNRLWGILEYIKRWFSAF